MSTSGRKNWPGKTSCSFRSSSKRFPTFCEKVKPIQALVLGISNPQDWWYTLLSKKNTPERDASVAVWPLGDHLRHWKHDVHHGIQRLSPDLIQATHYVNYEWRPPATACLICCDQPVVIRRRRAGPVNTVQARALTRQWLGMLRIAWVQCHDVPWCAMMCHDAPWCAMMRHEACDLIPTDPTISPTQTSTSAQFAALFHQSTSVAAASDLVHQKRGYVHHKWCEFCQRTSVFKQLWTADVLESARRFNSLWVDALSSSWFIFTPDDII